MDYQPIQPMDQNMNEGSSYVMWYIVGAVIVIAALAFWYYSSQSTMTNIQNTVVDQTQTESLTTSNSVVDIMADLNQTLDSSAELNQAAAASAQDVQAF